MEIIRGFKELNRSLAHPVVTIGNFDGVHLGHQKIIKDAISKAKERKGVTVAFTFRPHPQIALRPENRLPLLLTYDEKLEILGELGVDIIIDEPFSREFSTIPPETFFTDILLKKIGAEAIVVGYDFAFGKERQGHLDQLSAFCKKSGVEMTVVSPQKVHEEVASSSKIRQHLLAKEIESANQLLGREFFYRGIVVRGDGRGRKIGTPTANITMEGKLALPYGVYVTWGIYDGKKHKSVTNVGVRPTFSTPDKPLPPLVETHILDASPDLYGKSLEVRFVHYLREEIKFSGVEPLKEQIKVDIQNALRFLK